MGHIPKASLTINKSDFETELEASKGQASVAYNSKEWLYVPNRYDEYRFILSEVGANPLVCIGVNPSTASPGDLDNTLKRVKSVADVNGYDSFCMLNICAQRATKPRDMAVSFCSHLHDENMKAFEYAFSQNPNTIAWAAWGASIECKSYLKDMVANVEAIGRRHGVNWACAGRTKKGHPRHPLRLRKDTVLEPFDMDAYVASLK